MGEGRNLATRTTGKVGVKDVGVCLGNEMVGLHVAAFLFTLRKKLVQIPSVDREHFKPTAPVRTRGDTGAI
jgi:hypothetical protein